MQTLHNLLNDLRGSISRFSVLELFEQHTNFVETQIDATLFNDDDFNRKFTSPLAALNVSFYPCLRVLLQPVAPNPPYARSFELGRSGCVPALYDNRALVPRPESGVSCTLGLF